MRLFGASPRFLLFCVPTLAVVLLGGCGAGNFGASSSGTTSAGTATPALTGISTSVAALPGEDLVGPCYFDLLLPQPNATQAGVLVVYERGDSAELFVDPEVRTAMGSLNYAMVWAHQCVAASSGDLQANAAAGPARVLTAALTQFSLQTVHAELAQAPIIPFGFSAAGVLSVTLAGQLPARIPTLVAYAAGSEYTNLDAVQVSATTAAIPTLILANAGDNLAGDSRSLRLFERGRAIGAPWAFATQNATGHCCTLSTRPLMLPWIAAVLASGQKPGLSPATGAMATFDCVKDPTVDNQGEYDCAVASPVLIPASARPVNPKGTTWVPDQPTANAWLAWVTNPVTNN